MEVTVWEVADMEVVMSGGDSDCITGEWRSEIEVVVRRCGGDSK